MLYEFHRTQNAKRPGSVHATYLIYGVKYNTNSQNGGDEDMPDADSVTDVVPVYHLHLVTEEKLRGEFPSSSPVLHSRACAYCL